MKERALELRAKLMEIAAESDDELIEIYFEKGELTEEQFVRGLQQGFCDRQSCSGAGGFRYVKNIGVSRLLEFIIVEGPNPHEHTSIIAKPADGKKVEIHEDEKEPTCALVYKTITEPHVGELCYVRVFAGKIETGQ